MDHHYYTFSSIFFYTNRTALLLNGRFNNLVYGSYAPGAPNVFIDDAQWKTLWLQPERCYLVITREGGRAPEKLVDPKLLTIVAESGGKLLLTNHPVARVAGDMPHLEQAVPRDRGDSVHLLPHRDLQLMAVFPATRVSAPDTSFTPPVSILKPIRGLDPDAAENLASFCRLDYPEYEIVFCVDPDDAAVLSVLAKLTADFPRAPHSRSVWLRARRDERQSRQAGAPGERSGVRSGGHQR